MSAFKAIKTQTEFVCNVNLDGKKLTGKDGLNMILTGKISVQNYKEMLYENYSEIREFYIIFFYKFY